MIRKRIERGLSIAIKWHICWNIEGTKMNSSQEVN